VNVALVDGKAPRFSEVRYRSLRSI